MKVLDLFSGISGFSLGLERAGMQTVAFCEIDPFCQNILKKHWPGVPVYNDNGIREIEDYFTAKEIPEPLLCRKGDGVPDRVDRLRALGNSIVPQIVEVIGHAIMINKK